MKTAYYICEKKSMGSNSKLYLFVTYLLNVGVWTHHFNVVIKISYAILVGIVTMLGGLNQWHTFRKTYHNTRVVIVADYVINMIYKKKNRHYNRKKILPNVEKIEVVDKGQS